MATRVSTNPPVWPSIDFTDGLVPLNSIDDGPEEDCVIDGKPWDYTATTETFMGCWNILSGLKPNVWNQCWYNKFKKAVDATARQIQHRLSLSNLLKARLSKCEVYDTTFEEKPFDPYFNIELNFDTLEDIFREYQVEESNGTKWQKKVALEHALIQKLLEMEVGDITFEAIFAKSITDSFEGLLKQKKMEYYTEAATTKVVIRALVYYLLTSYDDHLARKKEEKDALDAIDAEAEELKKRLKQEHEATMKQKMSDFDTKMANMQEQMVKMQQMMQNMQKEKNTIMMSCESAYQQSLDDAEKARDAEIKAYMKKKFRPDEVKEDAVMDGDESESFQTLQDAVPRNDGSENNPHVIGDDDTPPESQQENEESTLPESQLNINSNMLAVKVAQIESGEVNGTPVEHEVPQVATKQAAQQLRIKEHMERVRADNEAAKKQQEEEEAAKLKKKEEAEAKKAAATKQQKEEEAAKLKKIEEVEAKKAAAGKRKRPNGSSSGSPHKRKSKRASIPPNRYVACGEGQTGYENDALLGMGKQKKGKTQVTSPNAVVAVENDKFERVN